MGIKEFFQRFSSKPEPETIVRIVPDSTLGDYDSTGLHGEYEVPEWGVKKAKVPDWYNQHPYGEVRTDNMVLFRQLAQMGFVSRVITKKLDKLFGTPWDIIPIDPLDDSNATKQKIEEIKYFLMECNSNESDYFSELRMAYQDKYELGEGVLVKAFNKSAYVSLPADQKVVPRNATAELRSIQAHDASQFFVFQSNRKTLLGHWQFNFVERPPEFFSPREIIVFKDQPVTWRTYGRSRIGQISAMLEMVFYWIIHMKNHYKGGALLQGFIKTIGLGDDEQKDLEAFVTQKMRKMKHKVGIFHGGKDTNIEFVPMMLSVNDIAALEVMDFFQRFVMSVYGIMPKDMGLPEVNRATGKEQTQDFEKQHKLELNEIAFRTNMEVVREFDPERTVEFKFIEEQDITTKATEAEIQESRLVNSVMTINEIRREMGLESVEWGDIPMAVQAQQFQLMMTEKNQQFQLQNGSTNGNPNGNGQKQLPEATNAATPAGQDPKKKEDITKSTLQISKAIDNDNISNEGITDTIRDQRLEKLTGKLVLNLDKKLQTEFTKIFDRVLEHVKRLTDRTRTVGVGRARHSISLEQVREIVINAIQLDELTQTLTDEMLAAYEIGLQLNDNMIIDQNIFNLKDRRALEYLQEYPLIVSKRVSDRIHNELSDIIYSGVNVGSSIPNITKKIKELNADYNSYQAERIARTEITNAVSWGKINQLRANGRKKWQFYATEDERTCPICSELHEKLFDIDDLSNKPPTGTHPNCRCTILSGVGEEGYDNDLDDLQKSFTVTKKQAEIELTRNESIYGILKQFIDEEKSARDVAQDLEISHQTANNWMNDVIKFNPNHDERGRFAPGSGGHGSSGSGSSKGKKESKSKKSSRSLRNISSKSVAKALGKYGFKPVRQKGSHQTWKNKDGKNVTLTAGKKSIPPKTIRSIISQMGISEDEFLDSL